MRFFSSASSDRDGLQQIGSSIIAPAGAEVSGLSARRRQLIGQGKDSGLEMDETSRIPALHVQAIQPSGR